jgi:hypothetical protein
MKIPTAASVGAVAAVVVLSACGTHRPYSVSVDTSIHPRLRPSQVAGIVQNDGVVAGKVERIVSMRATRRGLQPHTVWIVHVRGTFRIRAREVVDKFSNADVIVNDRTGRATGIEQTR